MLSKTSKRPQSAWDHIVFTGVQVISGLRFVRHFMLGRWLSGALVLEPCSRGHPGHEARLATT